MRQVNTNIYRHICTYVRMGYPVLPLHPGEKRPYSRLVPHGLKEATLDMETIHRWWDTAPTAGLGILPPENVLVLDCDHPDGWEFLSIHYPEVLEAPRQHTPRGGQHIFLSLRLPAGTRLSASTHALPGIDLRGMGRAYLVAAPTTLKTGKYLWELPLLPPAELPPVPEGLLRKLTQPAPAPAPVPNSTAGGEAAAGEERLSALLLSYATAVRQAPIGARHNTLVRYARAAGGLLPHGLPYVTAQRQLLEAALGVGLPQYEAIAAIRWGLEVGRDAPLHLEERQGGQRQQQAQKQQSTSSNYWNRVHARLRGAAE